MADENVAVQLNDGGRIRLSGKDIKNEKELEELVHDSESEYE